MIWIVSYIVLITSICIGIKLKKYDVVEYVIINKEEFLEVKRKIELRENTNRFLVVFGDSEASKLFNLEVVLPPLDFSRAS